MDSQASEGFEDRNLHAAALHRSISSLLSNFEKAKEWEWSDLIKWLRKVKNALDKHPRSSVPEKFMLAKRLAQCLNPSLPPGLHLSTLQIYDTILKHKDENGEPFDADYGLYSAGIFPYFLYASPQNKPEVLALLERYYLPKREAISLSLPGLVTCLLPAMEDVGNPDLVVRIFAFFDRVCEFDRRGMFSSAWLALLRTPRARRGALVFLSKRLPKGLEGEDSEYLANRSLFLNALISGINDTVILVQRDTLDLIKSHFPLMGRVLQLPEKVELLKAILQLLQRRDFTIQRRIWEWTLPDQTSEQQLSHMLEILIPALSDLFKEKPTTKEEAAKPLKIIEQLLENEVVVEALLGDVTMIILTYVERNSADRELSDDILHRSINLFTAMGDKKVVVWQALGHCLSERLNGDVTAAIRSIRFYLCTFPLESNDDDLILPLLEDLLTNIMRINSSALKSSLQLIDLMLSRLHSQITFDGPAVAFRRFFTSLSTEEEKDVEEFRLASKICINLEKHTSGETELDWLDCLLALTQVDEMELALVGMESLTSLLKSQSPCFFKLKQSLIGTSAGSTSNVVMGELWHLLETKYKQQAVSLICQLQQGAPEVFAKAVVEALQVTDVSRKVDGIRRFATLWKYASEEGGLARLFIAGDGLFIIIDCLQHESPIVRHCAREWLLDSVEQLAYIIDPLFDILAKPDREDNEVSRFMYTKLYDCPRTLEVVRKIKSVLLSGSDQIMKKAEQQTLTPRLKPAGKDINNYLELIVHFCSLFIETDPSPALDASEPKFKQENHAVQASMCGLMELVLSQGSPSLAYKTVSVILRSLEFSISIKDSVMQLLLLRQLRALFFNCNLDTDAKRFKELLQSEEFSNIYTISIFTPDLYVRTHWTQFLVDSFPLILAYVEPSELTVYLNSLVGNFCTLLHNCEDPQVLVTGLTSIVMEAMELANPKGLCSANKRFKENYAWLDEAEAQTSKKGFFSLFRLSSSQEPQPKANPFIEVLTALFNLFDGIIEASFSSITIAANPQNITSIGVLPFTHTRAASPCSSDFLSLLSNISLRFPNEFMVSVLREWLRFSVSQAEPSELSDASLNKLVKLCGAVVLDPVECMTGVLIFVGQLNIVRREENLRACVGVAHFLYCLFSELDLTAFKRSEDLWIEFTQVLKEFHNASVPGLQCWTLELINLMVQKTSINEALTNRKLKKDLHDLVSRVVVGLSTMTNTDFIYSPLAPSIYTGTREPIKEPIANLISLNAALYSVVNSLWAVDSEQKVAAQLQVSITNLMTALERKSASVDSELTAKLICTLFNHAGGVLVRAVRKQVIEFFLANDFFALLGSNRFALKHWSRVSNQLVLYCYYERSELVSELLGKIPSGVFVSKQTEKTQTAKVLKVLGLMIYGGAVDDFAGCIFILAEKLIEWLKEYDGNLLPLVLLNFRILVFKLSPGLLSELWPRVWPHLMSEMLEIFASYRNSSTPKQCQLVLACVKLLELMSLLNTEEFQLHQWVFFYDLFDIEFDVETEARPLLFNPVVPTSILPNLMAYYRPVNSEIDIRNERTRRSLLFTQQTVENKTELEHRMRNFIQVLLISCTERTEVDLVSVETVLEEDLLSQALCL